MANLEITSRKFRLKLKITKTIIFSVRTEILSLVDENDSNSAYQSTTLNSTFPNSMIVNGIAVALDGALSCQKTELGKMN